MEVATAGDYTSPFQGCRARVLILGAGHIRRAFVHSQVRSWARNSFPTVAVTAVRVVSGVLLLAVGVGLASGLL